MRFRQLKKRIKEIVSQVEKNQLDLQPNFQRGEVWSIAKQQRLVDSILRRWYVPPIHVIETADSATREVLDGQQRLRAICNFVQGKFAVDGSIQPDDRKIRRLDGVTYSQLPIKYRNRFNSFTITIVTITDYETAEPGELFFRLNHPVTLTGAEQRNAFYGPARDQVKKWVKQLEEGGINKSAVGFSNVRMAYDDTLARVALTIENRTLATKVTAEELVHMYRSPDGYSPSTDRIMRSTIKIFSRARTGFTSGLRFNKATLYSWFLFLVRTEARLKTNLALKFLPDPFGKFVSEFWAKLSAVYVGSGEQVSLWPDTRDRRLLLFYQNRATSRVADVSSVLLRDIVIWLYFGDFIERSDKEVIGEVRKHLQKDIFLSRKIYKTASGFSPFDEDSLESTAAKSKWGAFL